MLDRRHQRKLLGMSGLENRWIARLLDFERRRRSSARMLPSISTPGRNQGEQQTESERSKSAGFHGITSGAIAKCEVKIGPVQKREKIVRRNGTVLAKGRAVARRNMVVSLFTF